MNITEILRDHARTRPRAAALIDEHRGRLTFAELEEESSRGTELLKQTGIKPGDAVLVFCPVSAELYIILTALFRKGAVAMFLDPSAGRKHIEQCCSLLKPAALIATSKAHLLRLISPAMRRIPVKFTVGLPVPGAVQWSRAANAKPHTEIYRCDTDAPALITFTSGSTGKPKAAVRSHGFLLAQHATLERTLRLTAGESDLVTLPVFGLANLASSVTSIIPAVDLRFPGRIDAARVMAQIHKHQPRSTAASPAFLERVVDHCERTGERLSSFKKIFTGGAPVFPPFLERLQRIAPCAEIVAVYGSTEAEPIAEISRRDISRDDLDAEMNGRGLLAGMPVEEIQMRVVRDQWDEPSTEFAIESLRARETGEIIVAGDHVLKGYLNGEGDSETKIHVAGRVWHRTGDAGYLDERGRLWLVGRCSARVEDGRGVIYPFTVECAATCFPQIRRTAFTLHQGRRVLCIEVDRMNEEELNALKEKLSWAALDEIRIYPRLPVDARHNAKIDYPALRRLLDRSPLTAQVPSFGNPYLPSQIRNPKSQKSLNT